MYLFKFIRYLLQTVNICTMPTSTTASPVKVSTSNPSSPLKQMGASAVAATSSPSKRLRFTEKLQVRVLETGFLKGLSHET